MELRIAEKATFQGLFGDLVRVPQRTVRDARNLVEPEPNAPLLIRIVRYPYAETVGRALRRQLYRVAGAGDRSLQARPRPAVDSRAFRLDRPVGNPVKHLDLHPTPLAPPPSVDAWLASGGV